jgi:hypothetical protein
MRLRCGSLLAAVVALACAPVRPPGERRGLEAGDGAGRPAHVVLVSVAGLTPDRYLAGDAMPRLASLASEGVAAEQVEPVAPASAYPAHASLVTGVVPAQHAIVADQLLGERGVRRAAPSHASLLHAPALWQRVTESGGAVTALDWPTTVGAEIASLLPDVAPEREGERWQTLAANAATPWLAERVRAAPPAVETPGPARDALLVDLACVAFRQSPRLVLLRLRGAEAPLASAGPRSREADAAFAALDDELGRLVGCADSAGILVQTAFFVTGDRALEPVHTALRPNLWLLEEGWITPEGHWKALVRSNGSSAFVYANEARTALDVRRRLEAGAKETGAFRIVAAEEMIARGADPDAWFGLQAEPGFVFENAAGGAPVGAASVRAAGGRLVRDDSAPGTGLVAFGRGVRRGVLVPRMAQLDVAPTLAALLGVKLEGATGRSLVGLLRLAPEAKPRKAAPQKQKPAPKKPATSEAPGGR